MQNLNDSLIDNNVRQNKNSLRCCKFIFFIMCNGLSFTGGFLLSKYLEIKDSDGSL
tara:strand:+ start:327 stop:494 length:168 start_codon:yes stop_codon:yes gene_type:complete